MRGTHIPTSVCGQQQVVDGSDGEYQLPKATIMPSSSYPNKTILAKVNTNGAAY